ncbi:MULTISPECIES: ribonuclease P protein component [unclassified Thalassotalea]|uniref:ribonuclease P protein component n=1 Tax=unclassified Thalassotalea TaxID=2614972 RepID=UPI0010810655|nr:MULTISPECIES: ribonuclease P protein component [unclassified Thalassotalea]NMP17837.1 ribonuclease P protein component [Thalassotalea sp. Y01]QBY04417.1 ribonuclease P protein component [Thalassotalea sp. HSM 43]
MGHYEFNRESRLLTPGQFKSVFDNPSRFGSSHFTILVTSNTLDKPRLGMAIAKKRVKLAVQRNRVKRLVRESFRKNQHKLPAVDMVVMVKSGIDQLDNTMINQQLEKVWRKIKQRHKSSL